MRMRAGFVATLLLVGVSGGAAAQDAAPTYELRGARWFDGRRFTPGTRWIADGRITLRRPARVDSTLDLTGTFVVPAFGEAHNHNAVPSDTGVSNRYLREGIFYVKNPNSFPRDRDAAAGVFNTPRSIDVVFSNGGLTGPGGHPIDLVRRNVARGVWKPSDGEGAFMFSIGSARELDAKWPPIVATHPDFIKTYLLFSDEYARRLADSATVGWRGLAPDVLEAVVRRAHREGLRVSTHIETAWDFRAALAAGTDEINHLPGFRPEGNAIAGYEKLDRYRLTQADALEAARSGVTVVTTVSEVLEILDAARADTGAQAQFADRVRSMIVDNLRLLRDAGVRIVLGSDRYRTTSTSEATALRSTGIFSDTAVLRMWSMDTPKAIFPGRAIGSLANGAEASLLVLDGNPLVDWSAVGRIRVRIKAGILLNH